MELFDFSNMELGQLAPGGLFENYVTPNDHQSSFGYGDQHNIMETEGESSLFDSILCESAGDEWVENMGFTSDCMSSLLELQQITEVKSETIPTRPSVIIRQDKKTTSNDLNNILMECGIEEVVEADNLTFYPKVEEQVGSPATSEMSELEQTQELIDELEDFFIKTEGTPTTINEYNNIDTNTEPISTTTTPTINPNKSVISDPSQILKALSSGNVFNSTPVADPKNILTEEDLSNAYTTSVVTEDGQNVIIIIAPPSSPKIPPSPAVSPIHVNALSPLTTSDYESSYETDPDWAPSPAPMRMNNNINQSLKDTPPLKKTIKKKYARSKPLTPPSRQYPVEKKERKKAQNRTAAFRYREKKKTEQDVVDMEVEELEMKNIVLREKLTEMETEFKYLKKLMTEAGLGKYAQAVRL